jgi:hypothetical protein
MKFVTKINLSYSYIILFVAATLLASCESKRRTHQLGKEGQACSKTTPNFKRVQCASGLVCRTNEKCRPGMTGCTSFCLKPLESAKADLNETLGKEGQACSKTTPNFKRVQCAAGLVCRTNEKCGPGMTGCTSFCLKPLESAKADLNETLGKEGQACSKTTPNFKRVECAAGLVCRTNEKCRPGMKGCTSFCLKPKPSLPSIISKKLKHLLSLKVSKNLGKEMEPCYQSTPVSKELNVPLD